MFFPFHIISLSNQRGLAGRESSEEYRTDDVLLNILGANRNPRCLSSDHK